MFYSIYTFIYTDIYLKTHISLTLTRGFPFIFLNTYDVLITKLKPILKKINKLIKKK
jgi:hypothetical protein